MMLDYCKNAFSKFRNDINLQTFLAIQASENKTKVTELYKNTGS